MKILKRILIVLLLGTIFLFAGATFLHNTVRPSPEVKSLMDRKIDDFHQKLIHEEYAEIYAESDSGLKREYKENEFIDYLKKAREKLGDDLPKADISSQESLLNTIGRKFGRKVFQLEIIEITQPPNYKSEMFVWAIYGNGEIRLSSYKY